MNQSCAPCVTTPGLHASLSLLPHIHIIISSHWMTPKLTTLLVLHDTPSSVKRWHWSGVKRRKTLRSRDIFAVKTMHWFHSCKTASNNWANQNIWEVHWCGGSVLHLTCSPLAFGTTLLSSMSHLLPSSILSTSSFACWGEKKDKRKLLADFYKNKLDFYSYFTRVSLCIYWLFLWYFLLGEKEVC